MTTDYDAVTVDLKNALLACLDACDPPVEVARDSGKAVYAGMNLPELLAEALTMAARERGGVEALVRHRPGCWEAEHVRRLAAMADYPDTNTKEANGASL